MKDKNTGRAARAGRKRSACKERKKAKKRKYLGIRREIQVSGSVLVVVPAVDKKQIKPNTVRSTPDTLGCKLVVGQLQNKAFSFFFFWFFFFLLGLNDSLPPKGRKASDLPVGL